LEIRAGTGGDESALFAGDLLRMYTRCAERRGWRVSLMSESPSDLGGYKEVVLRVEGDQAYGWLRFESGGHRVQRVPTTETQGRIHTSACTVAVMPEPDEARPCKSTRPSCASTPFAPAAQAASTSTKPTRRCASPTCPPASWPNARTTDPSTATKPRPCRCWRPASKSKERSERAAKEAATRKGLIGSGDRSDRIRTYNFPQGRLTDHRINLTLYKLSQIMEGELDDVVTALQVARGAELLAELESQNL
jgi:peptide chain release factor 1